MMGGLALFLYGMNVMGDSLVKLSGGKLENILKKLTENRFMALMLGMFVTAVIQSSSATTVMVVGFVNSGIMDLTQAVGVIMGANIGTTITSWILSLTGISGENLIIELLKPSSFSPVLAAIGIVSIMTGEDGSKRKTIGNILLGFAVLMFGMETMSDAVAPLKDNEAFTGILTRFENPILGIAAGAILTAVIQSSSASVGILQAFCISGIMGYSTAVPIIMGQNIGTCVTALISSIGADTNAKRAAFIHLYFNLIGSILFMVLFYTLDHFIVFAFMGEKATALGIAVIHSIFNLGCAVTLFPFADLLVKLAALTVPETQLIRRKAVEPECLTALDERFLDNQSFAIRLSMNATVEMAARSRDALFLAMKVQDGYDENTVKEVIRLEQLVDLFEDKLNSYLIKLSGRDLNREDSHMLSLMLHTITDIERISDHAINLTEALEKMHSRGLTFTEQGKSELDSLTTAVHDIMNITIDAFAARDISNAVNVEPMEEVIDDIVLEMKQRHINRLRQGRCSMEAGLILEDVLTYYERISDHCSNIAVAMIEIETDTLDAHQYLEAKTKGSDPAFQKAYTRFKSIYILPA